MEQEPGPGAEEAKPDEARSHSSVLLRGGGREDGLFAASDFLAGDAGSNSEEPWTPSRWRLIRDRQIGLLREWSVEHGLWIDLSEFGQPEKGRMEHDIFPRMEPPPRLWKITKGAGFGRQPFCEENLVSGMVSD